jgi:small conductance mechanosensitive channel
MAMSQETLNKIIELGTSYGLRVIGALALLIGSVWLSHFFRRMSLAAMQRAKVDLTLTRFVANIVRWAVLAISLVSVLSMFGIETSSFAAAIAASGLALGLAFQGTLGNFAAGIILLVVRPFRTGHLITVQGYTGVVFEIDLFTTRIDTLDNRRIILPNSAVISGPIENMSEHDLRRIDILVSTPYSADLDLTRETLRDAIAKVKGTESVPEPQASLAAYSPSSVDWAVKVWVKTEAFADIKEVLLFQIRRSMDAAKITMPYPQMEVHLAKPSPNMLI